MADPEPPATHRIEIKSREDLALVLSEASTLEHMVMCEYLFAGFSLKRSESEGVTPAELEKLQSWRGVIETVAIQEMTHLALVNNMLVSIGSSPYFQHSNFPQPSRYFSPNIRLALMPFGEQALRHFLYLERPEGMAIEGVPGFEVLGDLNPAELTGGIVPKQQYFSTVGNLYRGIQKGFRDLSAKYGEEALFIGASHTQATEAQFGLPSLIAVKDLESADRAVEGIVEMGEGARGDWTNAHFGMFLRVFNEFVETRKANPSFRSTRPVVAAYAKQPTGADSATIITDRFTSSVADLFNASYGLAIQTLSRYYVHESDRPEELQALADTAVRIMARVIGPIGVLLTTLPVGNSLPGVTAGPSFELQSREYVLPHRREAVMVLEERLTELADHTSALSSDSSSPVAAEELKLVEESYRDIANGLASAFVGL